MKINILVLMLFLMMPAVSADAAPGAKTGILTLKGTVVTDSGEPVTNTRVTVSGGPGILTGQKGEFELKLSRDYWKGNR